jgi:flagellin FlaB
MSTQHKPLKQDERAEIGIGTMIVFIATILVSAVAAGVLINTSQKLQAKSQQTGNEATQNVASALNVIRVDGILKTAGGDIDQLDLTVQLASGADPVDLSKLVALVDTGAAQIQLTSCKTGGAVTDEDAEFAMDSLRGDVDDCGVMNAGDLVQLHLGESATPLSIAGGIETSTKVSISLIPAHGTSAVIGFTTPDGYGDATHLALF